VTDKDAVDGPGAGTDTEGAEDNKGLVSLSWASGPSGGQCKVGIGASSSTSSPASEEDADLAAVTARCIISRTPNLAGLPLFVGPLLPLPLVLLTDPAPLPFPEVVTAASLERTAAAAAATAAARASTAPLMDSSLLPSGPLAAPLLNWDSAISPGSCADTGKLLDTQA